jgi:hypothetical protein
MLEKFVGLVQDVQPNGVRGMLMHQALGAVAERHVLPAEGLIATKHETVLHRG